jgi:hypothetical protein
MACYEGFEGGSPDLGTPVAEGDIVMMGPTGALALLIMAVRGGMAWVRDLDDGRHGVVELASFTRSEPHGPGTLQ